MAERLHIDFQPVVELDLKDNRQLYFSIFWKNRSKFKIKKHDEKTLITMSGIQWLFCSQRAWWCWSAWQFAVAEVVADVVICRYLCLYANKSLHADLHLLAGHQIYMHQIYIWPSDIYASVSMRWETGHDANSNLHFFVVSLFYSSPIHIDFICPLCRTFPRFWLRNVPIYQVWHFLQ